MVHAFSYIFKSIVNITHNWSFKIRGSYNAQGPSRKSKEE